jgi:hypothetical protein
MYVLMVFCSMPLQAPPLMDMPDQAPPIMSEIDEASNTKEEMSKPTMSKPNGEGWQWNEEEQCWQRVIRTGVVSPTGVQVSGITFRVIRGIPTRNLDKVRSSTLSQGSCTVRG